MALPHVPTCPPSSLVAGDSATWDDAPFTDPRYGTFAPADGWVLTSKFSSPGSTEVQEVTGAVEGTGWRNTLTSVQSEALIGEGVDFLTVTVTQVVTQGTDQVTVRTFTFQLFPTALATAGEKSFARQMRDGLRDVLKNAGSSNILSYSIGNRSVVRESRKDTEKSLAKWEYAVWQEEHPGEFAPAIATRFTGFGVR